MGFYTDELLPKLCNLAMRNRCLLPYRRRVIALAAGRVLEIGTGSGLNLPFYGASVREILALEPSAPLIAMAQRAAGAIPVQFVNASAEAIPVDAGSVDTVVTTWTLCTIPDARQALSEMRRVLRPGGRLVFVEHGLAPEAGVRWWQERLTPMWARISGGCHLDRPVRELLEVAAFRIERLQAGYMPGLRPMSFTYEGTRSRLDIAQAPIDIGRPAIRRSRSFDRRNGDERNLPPTRHGRARGQGQGDVSRCGHAPGRRIPFRVSHHCATLA